MTSYQTGITQKSKLSIAQNLGIQVQNIFNNRRTYHWTLNYFLYKCMYIFKTILSRNHQLVETL